MNLRHYFNFVLIFFVATMARAQSWTQTNGPEKGTVTALAQSGNLTIMGTGGGLFMSSINGDSWGQRAFGGAFNAIAINGNVMLAAGTTTNVHRTLNGGSDWLPVNNGLASDYIWDMAFVGPIVFAATHTGGVLRSENTGDSWTQVNNGLASMQVWCLLVDGTTLYAGTAAGIFKSGNNGDIWTNASTGLGSGAVKALAIRGSKIFAATDGSGVYVSENAGGTWSAVNSGLTNLSVYSLAMADVSALYVGTGAGVFKSNNDGVDWSAVGPGINGSAIDVVLTNGNKVFAGTRGNGVYRSDDGGASWNPKNNEIVASQIKTLAVAGSNVFAGGLFNGVSRSTDGGNAWTNSGLASDFIDFVLINNGFVYACSSSGIYRSADNGDAWTLKVSGLASSAAATMAAHGNKLYAGSIHEIYRSADNGDSWTLASNGLPGHPVQVSSIVGLGGLLFAGTSTAGVFRSSDEGASWVAVNTGLSTSYIRNLTVNGTTLFAATTTGGVFRSVDNGNNWTSVNTGFSSLVMEGLFAADGLLLASSNCPGCIHGSTDNGSTWFLAGDGIIDAPREFAAGVGYVYSGSHNSGVYKRPLLLISSFSPAAGPPGTEVTISGFGFDSTTPANNVVTFQGVAATVTSATATTITAITPAAPFGRIVVSRGSAYAVSTSNFAVLPIISGFTPAAAPVGSTVTINGSGFNPVASQNVLYLNDQLITPASATESTLTFVVPSNASSGKIKITVFGNPVVSATDFLVTPTIASFSPQAGPTGTLVTITGASFSLTNTEVRVNGLLATITEKYTSLIKVLVPDGATTGKITVTVGGQEISTTSDFTVLPRIYGFSPTGARVGKEVLIFGTSFDTDASKNMLKFGSVNAVITAATSTQLTTTVPAGATSDFVSVTVNGHTVVSPTQFVVTYPEPLAITSIAPTSGPVGTLVTITGTGFSTQAGINQVSFNGSVLPVGAPSYSAHEVTAYVPLDAKTGTIKINVSGDEAISTQEFTVVIPKKEQTISFSAISARTIGDAPFSLTASASSGLPVSFSTVSDEITLSGNVVTLLKAGSVTIAADQGGDEAYHAATRIEQSFCINPARPTITLSGENTESILLTSSSPTGNQWFLNETAIPSATQNTLQPTAAGLYKVKVTADNCESEFSEEVPLIVTGDKAQGTLNVRIFPNPVTDKLIIELPVSALPHIIRMLRADGRVMEQIESTKNQEEVDTRHWASGIYLLSVSNEEKNFYTKIIKP